MTAADDIKKFDGIFIQVAQAANGIDGLLDTFFSFLSRKTDFYEQPEQAEALCLEHFRKHIKTAAPPTYPVRQTPFIEEVFDEPPAVERPLKAAASKAEAKVVTPTITNGAVTDKYSWSQTLDTVELTIPLDRTVRAKDCKVTIGNHTLQVLVCNDVIIDGKLTAPVHADASMWTLVDSRQIQITLDKATGMNWWSAVMEGDPEIDTSKITPENSKLSDLDNETRQTVEKMMFDQRQKQMGLPTSEQLFQEEMLAKLKKVHPELDFSGAKFSS